MSTERTSPLATSPTDGTREPDFEVDARVVADVEERIERYISDLMEPLRAGAQSIVADKVRGIAALYYCTLEEVTVTAAKRKARIRSIADAFAGIDRALDCIMASEADDPEFFRSPLAGAVLDTIEKANDLRKVLQAEQARIGPPSKSDGHRIREPVRHFLQLAQILWLEEGSTMPDKSNPDYRAWLTLLFEVVTGEAGRSFDKALRTR